MSDIASVDHAAAALGRLRMYLKDKPNVAAILNAFTAEAQALEAAMQDLLTERAITTAVGAQLDVLGAIVGLARHSLTDTPYRTHIQAAVLLNRDSGTIGQVLAIMVLLAPTATWVLRDEWPAAFALEMHTFLPSDAEAAELASFFRRARAAGVKGILEYRQTADANMFTLDGTLAQAFDSHGHFATAVE